MGREARYGGRAPQGSLNLVALHPVPHPQLVVPCRAGCRAVSRGASPDDGQKSLPAILLRACSGVRELSITPFTSCATSCKQPSPP